MWILYSIFAAVLWGIDYAVAGKLLGKLRFSTLLMAEFFFGFLIMAIWTWFAGSYKRDLPTIVNDPETWILLFTLILTFNIAHVLIILAIGGKGATLASLVEVSYPLFVAVFSWLLFGQKPLSAVTAVGGLLILCGVTVIYLGAG